MPQTDFLPLDTSARLLCGQLEWLRELAENNESQRHDRMIVFNQAIEDARKESDSDYAYYLEESAIDNAQQYDCVYLHAQRTGLIFSVYAMVEAYLNEECQFCRTRFLCDLKLKDVANKGLRRGSLYLRKVVKCDPKFFDTEFNNMFMIGDLRNVLIHSDGRVDPSQKKKIDSLNKYARKHGDPFQIKPDGNVVLTSRSSAHVIDISESLVTAVGRAIVNRTKRTNA